MGSNPNKGLFLKVVSRFAEQSSNEGFEPHPAYPDAVWEPSNQDYEYERIRIDADHIDQLGLSFAPQLRTFFLRVDRRENTLNIRRVSEVPTDPHVWLDRTLNQPYRQFQLHPQQGWFPSNRTGLTLREREIQDIEVGAQRAIDVLIRDSRYLFDALRDAYAGRFIKIVDYNIKRP